MSQTAFGIQARSSVLPSTRLNTKVLPIPSSNCFRHAHLVVLVRRNRLISSYSWELSVRRCLNDGHSEQASSGTSTRAEVKAGASYLPERLCPGGCRSPPASEASEIPHARVGSAVSCRSGVHNNSELEFLGGRTD